MEQETIVAHAYRVTLDDRIAELWHWRQWCRRQPDAAFWSPLRREYEVELRALVALARKARALAAPAVESADSITAAKGQYPADYHDWQADFNVEGQPEFNGAFR